VLLFISPGRTWRIYFSVERVKNNIEAKENSKAKQQRNHASVFHNLRPCVFNPKTELS